MMKPEVRQIVDKAKKMSFQHGLAYLDDIIRDLNVERADMRVTRTRKKLTKKEE